jgi:2'-5' RNA ligase
MRCFIGVPLPENVRLALVRAQDCFRGVDARMSVVNKENLHITLHFLGNVENIPKIDEVLREVKFTPFKASVKDISFFPKRGYIRVIHSPVKKGSQELVVLQQKILEALGESSDKISTPHATLARVKFVKSTNALSRACYDAKFEEEFDVNSFNLYSSKLTPKGSIYTVLHSYP